MKEKSGPHLPDVAIGQRIRERRRAVGLSQAALAASIGVTFQQVQKYERGMNRVSFSRLVEIARTLDCGLSDLADSLEAPASTDQLRHLTDLVAETDAIELLEAFAKVRGRRLRRSVIRHVRVLGGMDDPAAADR
jgi:transcriptional regulator with XRE-family HTH domain